MRQLRGRRLHPESGQGDVYCYADVCLLPLSPLAPAPAPAPPPRVRASPGPCPHFAPPAPAPTASWGRRDQGPVNGGYGSTPGGGDHNRRPVTIALAAVAAIAFVSLILLGVSVLVRRRQERRRRQALLAAPATGPAAPTDADDPEGGGGGGGGGVVHHIWYIRTVGLDEAAIDSIAATRYRAGAGLLGSADCTVCLGEFQDGELVRLLPKCGHAFHVPCIDTWLRAHVNCPLCRSDVLDPAVSTDTGDGAEPSTTTPPADPVEDDHTAAAEQADATSEAMAEHEQNEGNHRGPSPPAEEDQHEQSSLQEPVPHLPRALPHNVRRAASMDAAAVSTAADVAAALERLPEAAPEEEQSGRRKRGTTTVSVPQSNLSTDRPAGIPRSFFSRHCRTRSSVSPL